MKIRNGLIKREQHMNTVNQNSDENKREKDCQVRRRKRSIYTP